MPFVVPPLLKWALAACGGAAVLSWAVREIRRINDELDRVKTAPAVDAAARKSLPTLRRDPATGEWRLI